MSGARARVAVAALLAAGGVARADGFAGSGYDLGRLLSLGWEAGRPVGSLRDYVDATSFRGLAAETRFAVAPRLSVGLAASWSWLAQNRPSGEVAFTNAVVTGPVYQRVQLVTLRATAHWYLARGPLQPYVGVACGGAWNDARQEIGGLAIRSRGYGLTADPEVGLLLAVRPGVALHLQARYQWTRNRFLGVKDAAWIAVAAGLALY